MAVYDYTKMVQPYLDDLWSDIDGSAMTNKSQQGATWEEALELLHVYFETDLDAGNKTILDGIIAALPPLDP